MQCKPGYVPVTVQLPRELRDQLAAAAAEAGCSYRELFERAMRELLSKRGTARKLSGGATTAAVARCRAIVAAAPEDQPPTCADLSAVLTREGYRTVNGAELTPRNVRRVLAEHAPELLTGRNRDRAPARRRGKRHR